MDLFGVVYTSRATKEMLPDDIDRLLVSARAHNARLGISGVLLYGSGRFFQYFEGAREGVDDVYGRIRQSASHTDIIELAQMPISHRLFNRWFMGFSGAPASLLQQLSDEQWIRERPWMETQETSSDGMRRLVEFINDAAIEDAP